MKTNFLTSLILILATTYLSAQTVSWQNIPNGPNGGFWDMDTMNGKLYVSTGVVQQYDGSTWTILNDYNNSLNTGNKTKSCVKNIDGKLYAGAKDFNTKGEGDVHYYDGSAWSLMQNAKFPYNGSYKIRSFCKYNSSVYMAGNFEVPNATSFKNIAKWDGTEWVNVGRNFLNFVSTNEIIDMVEFKGNLFITEKSNVWRYNGTTWDSLFYPISGGAMNFPMVSGVNDLIVYNDELYISGYFYLDMKNTNIPLVKYDGTTFTVVASPSAPVMRSAAVSGYSDINKMGIAGNKLLFVAKKSSDNGTYLVGTDGTNATELTKLASSGDFTIAPGSEYTTYSKILEYNNSILIGGNFQKIGGVAVTGLASTPSASVLGLSKDVQQVQVLAYPNPSSTAIQFQFSNASNPTLTIENQLGQVVMEQKNVQSNQVLNHALPSGVYTYTLKFDNGVNTGKLVINR